MIEFKFRLNIDEFSVAEREQQFKILEAWTMLKKNMNEIYLNQ